MAIGTAMALLAAGGAGANLLGGIFGKRAATSAAKGQAAAAAEAARKVEETTARVNPEILAAARRAGLSATDAARVASEGVNAATGEANKLLNPYLETGGKATELLSGELDTTGKMPTQEQLQMDPGYEFRRKEGEKALLSRAAATGLSTGGGTIKAALRYSSDLGSQEYQAAFDRFRTTNADRFNRLLAVSQQGQQAAGTSGGNLIRAGEYGGDINYRAGEYAGDKDYGSTVETGRNSIDSTRTVADLETQKANAIAAGKVGGANALMGGITGAADSLTSAVVLRNLLKNPAAAYKPRFRTLRPMAGLDVGVPA